MITYRIRIYSKLFGIEDFVGYDDRSLTERADRRLAAYRQAGIECRYIGII